MNGLWGIVMGQEPIGTVVHYHGTVGYCQGIVGNFDG